MATLRQKLGCWVRERWQAELAIAGLLDWRRLRNRHERLTYDPRTGGYACNWADSSKLTLARVFPSVGQRLLRAALRERQTELVLHSRSAESPPTERTDAADAADAGDAGDTNAIDVSFLIGLRGAGRLPQFVACVRSLLAQQGRVEVVVVEQSDAPLRRQLEDALPPKVRIVRTPGNGEGYNRSWALNVAARSARGRYVVVLDADMVLPQNLADEVVEVMDRGQLDAWSPVRYLFYLDPAQSAVVQAGSGRIDPATLGAIATVAANLPNPIAVRRDVYERLGGHDESFVGWGGEDDEFIDRLQTVRYSGAGRSVLLHLWHESAVAANPERNRRLLRERLATDVDERIAELAKRRWGRVDAPDKGEPRDDGNSQRPSSLQAAAVEETAGA